MNRGTLVYNLLDYNKVILDVGCANGYYTKLYAKKCKRIIGIDSNHELIKRAKEENPKIEFIEADAEKIPFEDEEFDIIIMSDVLEHVKSEELALNEVYRVLKKNGKLIITVPNRGLFDFLDVDNYSWYARKFKGFYRIIHKMKGRSIPKIREGYKNKHRHYSLEDLKKLLKKFKIEKYKRNGFITGNLGNNLELFFRWVFNKEIKLTSIKERDYKFDFGRFSSSIFVIARK